MTLYAKWTINQYTVTFKDENGEIISQITDDYGKAITVPKLPTVTGYTASWNETPVTSIPGEDKVYQIVLTAMYTITYENMLTGTHNNPIYYADGDTITFDAPTNVADGYYFLRWEIDGETVTGIDSDTTGNIVVRARWSIRVRFSTTTDYTYTIRVTVNNGNCYSDKELNTRSNINNDTSVNDTTPVVRYVLDGTNVTLTRARRGISNNNRAVRLNGSNYSINTRITVDEVLDFDIYG